MLKKTLIRGVALATLFAFAPLASAQSPRGSESAPGAAAPSPSQSQTAPSPRGAGSSSGAGETTGQVPQVQLSSQQRTELRQQFQRANIRAVTRDRINVALAVGSVLPATVEFVAIPDPILAIAPQFRGHQVVRVGDEILIVEPATRRIVYIIGE